jgi:DNA-binding transcriptional MerR regulator
MTRTATVSVGQFATMTHLSVKTLRHYHQVGLLEPARVDAESGYRYYSLDQLPTAQLIRRLRDLKMPIADVRSVLVARDPDQRNVLIGAHMDRLETELSETRAAVNSLRALLDTARSRAPISRRTVPAFSAIAITETIGPDGIVPWWEGALSELRTLVHEQNLRPAGPAGGVFDERLYQQDRGQATMFIPIDQSIPVEQSNPVDQRAEGHGRVRLLRIPAAELAVTTHHGSIADIDLAYADLGSYLAEQQIEVGPQIREHYLADQSTTPDATRWQTEIAWSIRTP